jgi:Na+-transporting methylmalonyl-CoA/oxaloacetate decarboxylase beta subunit
MIIVGILFNPMNVLAFRLSDLYLSLTLFYGGMLMASNMVWSHEIVHYLSMGHFNKNIFFIGIILSLLITFLLLRNQFLVDDTQWLKRMISHHSTALTTSHNIVKITRNKKLKKLARDIIDTQEKEIALMISMI